MPNITDYRPSLKGIHLSFDDDTQVDISSLDALLLLSLLSRDREKLEHHIFPEAPEPQPFVPGLAGCAGPGCCPGPRNPVAQAAKTPCKDEYAVLRARTEKLLEHARQLDGKLSNTLLKRPHLASCPHCGHLHDSRLIEQCAENPLRNSILRLPWPMRCSVSECGLLAHDAITVTHPSELGAWIMRPICHTCAFYPERWRHWIEDSGVPVVEEALNG